MDCNIKQDNTAAIKKVEISRNDLRGANLLGNNKKDSIIVIINGKIPMEYIKSKK